MKSYKYDDDIDIIGDYYVIIDIILLVVLVSSRGQGDHKLFNK